MEAKLTSHFQKLHFLQNLVQVLTRSTITTLRKLSNVCRQLLCHKQIGDADQNARSICDVFRDQKTEAVTSLLQEQKILNEYVPNNMGEIIYKTEVKRMVRNTVKK